MTRFSLPLLLLLTGGGVFAASGAAQPAQGEINAAQGIVTNMRLESGVPLGGIGTGKVELLTDGAFGNATLAGGNVPLVRGSFFAVRTAAGGPNRTAQSRVLALSSPFRFPRVAATRYQGRFPRAVLECSDPQLPVDVRIEAWSSLIPRDLENSSLPAVVFDVEVINPAEAQDVTIALSWENLMGAGGDRTDHTGNFQEPAPPGAFPGLLFRRRGEDGAAAPEQALLVAAPAESVKILPHWNALGEGVDFWTSFDAAPPFAQPPPAEPGVEGRVHPAGAAAVTLNVPREGSARTRFVLAWKSPQAGPRPVTGRRWESAWSAAEYAARYADTLRSGVDQWQELIRTSTLPEWLRVKLINDLYPIVSEGRVTADGLRFGEDPNQLAGSSWFTTTAGLRAFYPSLAAVSAAATPEAACERILSQWIRHRVRGDQAAGPPTLSAIHADLDALVKMDADGDGIPEGPTSWTYAPSPGSFSYTASLYLAALAAAQNLGEQLQDRKLRERSAQLFETARAAAVTELWNGRYLIRHLDPVSGTRSLNVFSGALAGEAVASITGLQNQYAPDLRSHSLQVILDLLATPSGYVTPNEVRSDGSLDPAVASQSWPGYLETWLAAPALAAGRADVALRMVYHLHEMRWAVARSPWSAPLGFDSKSGAPAGPRNHASIQGSWNLLSAYVGASMDEAAGRLTVKPGLAAADTEMRGPYFGERRWLGIEYLRTPASSSVHLRIRPLKRFDEHPDLLRELVTQLPPGLGGEAPLILLTGPEGEIPAEVRREDSTLRLLLKQPYEWRLHETIELAIVPQRANNLMVQLDPPAGYSLGSELQVSGISVKDRDIRFDLINPAPGAQVANVRFRDAGEQPYDVYLNGVKVRRFTPLGPESRLPLLVPGGPLELSRIERIRAYQVRLAALREQLPAPVRNEHLEPLLALLDAALQSDLAARTAEVLLHPVRRSIVQSNPLKQKPEVTETSDPEEPVLAAEAALREAPRRIAAALDDAAIRRALLSAFYPVDLKVVVDENAEGRPAGVGLLAHNLSESPVRVAAQIQLPPEWGGSTAPRLAIGPRERGEIYIRFPDPPELQQRRAPITGTASVTADGVTYQVPLAGQIGHDYIRHWNLIGVWPGGGPEALAVALPPDRSFEPDAAYSGRRWRISPDTDPPIDLAHLDPDGSSGVAYAATQIFAPQAGAYFLDLALDGLVQARLNGNVIYTAVEPGPGRLGTHRIPLPLTEGWNTLQLKLVRTSPEWRLLAEVTTAGRVTPEGLRTRPAAEK